CTVADASFQGFQHVFVGHSPCSEIHHQGCCVAQLHRINHRDETRVHKRDCHHTRVLPHVHPPWKRSLSIRNLCLRSRGEKERTLPSRLPSSARIGPVKSAWLPWVMEPGRSDRSSTAHRSCS